MKSILLTIFLCITAFVGSMEHPPRYNSLEHNSSSRVSYHKQIICVRDRLKSLDFSSKYPRAKTLVFDSFDIKKEKVSDYYKNQLSGLGLSNNTNLRSIEVHFLNVDGVLKNSYLPNLTHLMLLSPWYSEAPNFDLTVLQSFPNLKYLEIEHINPQNWENVLKFGSSIEYLHLSSHNYFHAPAVEAEELLNLAKMPNLKTLHITIGDSKFKEKELEQMLKSALPHVHIIVKYTWLDDPDYFPSNR